MTRQRLLPACGLFLILVSPLCSAHAQDKPWLLSTPDENAQRALQGGDRGVVFVETIVSEKGNDKHCSKMEIFLARVPDGIRAHVQTRIVPLLPGFGKTLGGAIGLLPGDYIVTGISCMPLNQNIVFNGPHANLRIRVGEIVDAGAIRLDVRGREGFIPQTTFIHRSVEPLTPEVVAYFKEEYPKTFSRAVKRPLHLAGPADVQYKGIGF